MKLGGRREYGKINSWSTRTKEVDVTEEEPMDEYSEEAPAVEAPTYTPRAMNLAPDAPSDDYASIIGPESTWNGNLTTEGSIRIEGNVLGEVRATGTVFISDSADVRATVYGKFVIVAGAFDGNLYCSERLELQPESRIKGAINTKSLAVAEGAFIDGEIHMGEVEDFATSPLEAAARPSGNGRGKKDSED